MEKASHMVPSFPEAPMSKLIGTDMLKTNLETTEHNTLVAWNGAGHPGWRVLIQLPPGIRDLAGSGQ
jgi:hypothetical protein